MPSGLKKELTVQEWVQEINMALEYRRQYACEESWARLEALVYNVHGSQQNAGPNILMETLDAMLSALLVPDPYITIKARRSDLLVAARVQESVDNELLVDLDIAREVAKAVTSAYCTSQGVLKVGYDSEFGYDPDFDLGGKRSPLGMTMTQHSKYGDRIEFGPASPGMPWVKFVPSQDFAIPMGCSEIDEAPWVAHRVVRHIDEVKADPKYSSRGLQPNMSLEDWTKSYESTVRTYRFGNTFHSIGNRAMGGDGAMEYVELWEIHDRRTGKVYVIATGFNSFLRDEVDVLQLEGGLPFVSMSFVPRSRNFWTTPDAYYLEQVQNELNDIAIQGTKHRRARVMKAIVPKGMFQPDELENFMSPEVGVVVQSESLDADDLQKRIVTFNPPADQGLALEAQMTRSNARSMIGLSANQVGDYQPTGRRTAAEATIVNNASTLRMDRRARVVATAYVKLFQIINPIIWKFWTTPRLTQVMDQDGTQQWVKFTGEHLKGNFAYSVGFSTGGTNETLQQRRQNALQLWAMMSQNPFVDPTGLARYLNLAFNDPEFTGVFKQGALNGQLQSQMQQMAAMQQMGAQNGGQGNQGSAGFNAASVLGQPVGEFAAA